MKDAVGHELHEGDLVFIQITSPVLRCRVTKTSDGGLSVPINPTQKGVTLDRLELVFGFSQQLTDAPPGQPHPLIHRIPDPETERIVKIGA